MEQIASRTRALVGRTLLGIPPNKDRPRQIPPVILGCDLDCDKVISLRWTGCFEPEENLG